MLLPDGDDVDSFAGAGDELGRGLRRSDAHAPDEPHPACSPAGTEDGVRPAAGVLERKRPV